MVSKQIWRQVLPHVRTGSSAEKEWGESRTMPGSLKKKNQQQSNKKPWSPPYFEGIVFFSKAKAGTICSPVTHHLWLD